MVLRPRRSYGRAVFTGRDVQLVCGACGAVFADVHLAPLATGITVTSLVTGAPVAPRRSGNVHAEVRGRLARAESPALQADLRTVDAYLRREGGEVIYEIGCRCGRRHLRSAPHLRTEIKNVNGRWVTLAPGVASWAPPDADS
jgi:hypothetical protein